MPAKLTNALYEHVEEPEASPTIPSCTAGKHTNKQTMNGTTTLAFQAVRALWPGDMNQSADSCCMSCNESPHHHAGPSPSTEVFDEALNSPSAAVQLQCCHS